MRRVISGIHDTSLPSGSDQSGSFLTALRACSQCRDLELGQRIHSDIETSASSDLFVATSMVSMYAKCGSVLTARMVFDRMPCHSVVSWNALILGHVENNENETALELFSRMTTTEVTAATPDHHTLTAAAMACGALTSREPGEKIHGKLVKRAWIERAMALHSQAVQLGCDSHLFLAGTLVDLYAKCGSMLDARIAFDRVPFPDVVLWTALILGYVENDEPELGLQLFQVLLLKPKLEPDERTFVAALVACSSLAAREEGKIVAGKVVKAEALKRGMVIHSEATRRGFDNIFLAATLIDFYAKCGCLADARKVFERSPSYNVVVWNSLILGSVENGEHEAALELFARMEREGRGATPDYRTFVAAVMATTALAARETGREVDGKLVKIESLKLGRALHSRAAKRGFDGEAFVASSLVEMYVSCGSLAEARQVFDTTKKRDAVLWNAMLMALAENGESEQALELFSAMQEKNSRSFVAALVACGNLVALETGRSIHDEISRRGFHTDPFVANCLVVFYGKCASMAEARQVFDSIATKNLLAWNALLAGYSRQGDSKTVMTLLEKMGDGGIRADGITFLSVLAACSHAGLVDRGREFFEVMESRFGVTPAIEHYHCMIDLLGRANKMEEAVAMVEKMPYRATPITWNTLLAAAKKWNNPEVGKLAYESLMELDGRQSSTYALMAGTFCQATL